MDAKWQGITVKKLLHDGIVLIGLYLFVPFCETDLISKSQRRQTAKTNKVVFTLSSYPTNLCIRYVHARTTVRTIITMLFSIGPEFNSPSYNPRC